MRNDPATNCSSTAQRHAETVGISRDVYDTSVSRGSENHSIVTPFRLRCGRNGRVRHGSTKVTAHRTRCGHLVPVDIGGRIDVRIYDDTCCDTRVRIGTTKITTRRSRRSATTASALPVEICPCACDTSLDVSAVVLERAIRRATY